MRQRLVAELLGTLLIVFAPCAASATGANLLFAALVSGLAVTAAIGALGGVSGDFNPAVTLAFASIGRRERHDVLPFILAQAAGGLLAALLARLLFGPGPWGVHAFTGAATQALGLEVVISFFLMLVILGTPAASASLVIGLWVVVAVCLAGPVTGGSMNPARSLGPALLTGGAPLAGFWVYALGPTAGALLAACVHKILFAAEKR